MLWVHLQCREYVEETLTASFHRFAGVAPALWQTYARLAALALQKYGLRISVPALPERGLNQGEAAISGDNVDSREHLVTVVPADFSAWPRVDAIFQMPGFAWLVFALMLTRPAQTCMEGMCELCQQG
jgi:hypothetical protein